ncbi:MAG TPA: CrcB family protein [Dehalococcoidia bacterium]
MQRILLIAVAGAFGALSRYKMQGWVTDVVGRPTLWATFVVNISGAFALGLLVALSEGRWHISPLTRTVLGVGFLGAYTTFSTLMFESVDRMETADYMAAAANIIGSVTIGLIAAYGGLSAGRAI